MNNKTSYTFKTEDDLLNFGKYEGQKIGDIMRMEPLYIDWCIENFKGFKMYKKLLKVYEEIKNENNKTDGE